MITTPPGRQLTRVMHDSADRIGQVVDDLVHHHSIGWLVGDECATHRRRRIACVRSDFGFGKRNGLLAVVHAEIPAVAQAFLQDALRAADVKDEASLGHSAPSRSELRGSVPPRCFHAVAASCPSGSPARCHAPGSIAPGTSGIGATDSEPSGHLALHQPGHERCLGSCADPIRLLSPSASPPTRNARDLPLPAARSLLRRRRDRPRWSGSRRIHRNPRRHPDHMIKALHDLPALRQRPILPGHDQGARHQGFT